MQNRNVLLLNTAAALFMTGVIWMVQVAHYPLMRLVGSAEFIAYHNEHTLRISFVVGPAMFIEGTTSVFLLVKRPAGVPLWPAAAGLACALAAYGVTAAISIPYHNRLSQGFDAAAMQALIETNWIRTVCWTLHGAFSLGMVWLILGRERIGFKIADD